MGWNKITFSPRQFESWLSDSRKDNKNDVRDLDYIAIKDMTGFGFYISKMTPTGSQFSESSLENSSEFTLIDLE